MSKLYYSFILLFCFYFSNGQNTATISGTVLDINTQLPLESATVYVSNVKDSTVIEFTNTNKSGVFKMVTKKTDKPVFLKVSYMGYQPYIEEQKGVLENKDFGKSYIGKFELDTYNLNLEGLEYGIKKCYKYYLSAGL